MSTKATTDQDGVSDNQSRISSPPTSSLRQGGNANAVDPRKQSVPSRRSTSLAASKPAGRPGLTPDRISKGGAQTLSLENNYKLDPDTRFSVRCVETIMRRALEERLAAAEYEPNAVEALTKDLSETIKSEVKSLGFIRHKLISHVVIGPLQGQAVQVASRFVWDDSRDNYASVSYQNSSIFAVASVYGVYYE